MTKHSVAAAFPKGLGLFLCFSLACPASLRANPVGGAVANGAATITYGGTTTIDQTTERAVIDWTSFSIAGGETTLFNQPGADSAVLNRVSAGGGLSEILGNLTANGNVFLINPNGILVGATGVVDTNGFVASTLDVNDAEFMLGSQFTFTGPLVSGAGVRNEGNITALGGDVVLIAQTVSNAGAISASNGTAALAAGSNVLYMPLWEGEHVFVQAGIADGDATGVDQTLAGTIQAAAAELKAAGGNVYSLAVNNSGAVNADQVGIIGGRIYLTAEDGVNRGTLSNSGTLAAAQGAFGGEVYLSGDQVVIESGSSIAAGDLQVTGDTEILLNEDVSTDGGQAYHGPVVVGGDRLLSSVAGDIIFNGTVDSADDGTVSSLYFLRTVANGGLVSFNGDVGAAWELNSVDVAAAAIGLNANVTTDAFQSYAGPVDVGADAALNAGTNVQFSGTVDSANSSALSITADEYIDFGDAVGATALGDLTLTTLGGGMGAGYVNFSSTLDSDGAVVIDSAGTTEFQGNVGGGRPLGGDLTIDGAGYIWFVGTLDAEEGTAVSLTSPDDIYLDGAVGSASLGSLDVDGGYVSFSDTLDSHGAVSASAVDSVDFSGNVGSILGLGDLTVVSGNNVWFGGTLDGGAVSLTAPNYVQFDGAVGSVSLGDLTAEGGYVDFNDALDSDGSVVLTAIDTVDLDPYVDFNGIVGGRSLGSLTVTAPDPGFISVYDAVHTNGAQTYNGAVYYSPTDGTSDASFTSAGGAIGFLGLLDANGFGVSVDAGAGDLRWDGSLSVADALLKGANLIMNGDVNSTGAGGVVMVAANSFNNASASAITTDPSARWLIYSDAAALDAAGGLTGESEQGVAYPQAPAFAGNGFLYATAAASAAAPANEPAASELDSFEASLAPPPVLVAAGGDSMDGGGSDEDSGSENGEEEKDGDE